jgi:phospholipid/cholesterol/gamma-HCH transport system substrate-binding protein
MNGIIVAPVRYLGRWTVGAVRTLGKAGYLAAGDVDSIIANTRVITTDLKDVSGDVSSTSASLTATLALADSTMSALSRIAARVEQGDGSLGRLISVTALAIRAEDLLEELNLLMQDLRANPRKYVRLYIF